jgi:hypothetical protein
LEESRYVEIVGKELPGAGVRARNGQLIATEKDLVNEK